MYSSIIRVMICLCTETMIIYISPIAKQLFENGYDLDYVIDKMLLDPGVVQVSNKRLVSPGSTHKVIVIANCTYMEDTTLQRIFNLANAGVSVVVIFPLMCLDCTILPSAVRN